MVAAGRGTTPVKKDVGRVRRSESEEIRVSFQQEDGAPTVELRVFSRSPHHGGAYLPEPEAISVPADALSDLCRLLERAHDQLMKEGLKAVPRLGSVIPMEPGQPAGFQVAGPSSIAPEAPRRSTVPVKLPFDCYILGGTEIGTGDQGTGRVTGEIRVLSANGAHVWLPDQLPLRSRLAVFLRIGEMTFRAQAEVADVASHPKDGHYRHALEWLSLSSQARAALDEIMKSAK